MREGTFEIINDLGLHARAAAKLLNVAKQYNSTIILQNPKYSVSADARSILNVLTLSASIGTTLNVNVAGADEDEAFAAIDALFSTGFGEI